MIKIFFILCTTILTQLSYSQNAEKKHNDCLGQISKNKDNAAKKILNSFYLENPNPTKFVMLACQDHCPLYYCAKHFKQCENTCDCAKNYQFEIRKLELNYSSQERNCDEIYQSELKIENLVREREVERLRIKEAEKVKKDELKQKEDKKKVDEKEEKDNKSNPKKEKEKKSTGNSSTYVETEEERQIKERAEAKQKANEAENILTTTAVTGVAALGILAANNTDNDFDDKDYGFIARGLLGANYQQVPVTANYLGSGFINSSESSTTAPICLHAGLDLSFLSNKIIGFNLNPFINYGLLAFSSSTGSLLNYGGNGNIKFGKDFQFLLKGGYEKRKGRDNNDAANLGINGIISSKYSYNTIKYGVGLKYKFVELAILKENLSFLKNVKANVYSYEFTIAADIYGFSFKYAPNYPIAGDVKYANAYTVKKQSYLQLGMFLRFAFIHAKGLIKI